MRFFRHQKRARQQKQGAAGCRIERTLVDLRRPSF